MKNNKSKEIVADQNLIAFCGLYCGACAKYLKGNCKGCKENSKATWCKVRQCCLENKFLSCADCKTIELKQCKKYNNFMSKLAGLLMNSDRSACICKIKEIGYDGFAKEMAEQQQQSIKRKK